MPFFVFRRGSFAVHIADRDMVISVSFDFHCLGEVCGDTKVDWLPGYRYERTHQNTRYIGLAVSSFYIVSISYNAGLA